MAWGRRRRCISTNHHHASLSDGLAGGKTVPALGPGRVFQHVRRQAALGSSSRNKKVMRFFLLLFLRVASILTRFSQLRGHDHGRRTCTSRGMVLHLPTGSAAVASSSYAVFLPVVYPGDGTGRW